MNEWIMIGLLGLAPMLYCIGGKGFKWVRRFILPLILGIGAVILSESLLRGIGVWLLATGCFHLGYGESASDLQKILVMLAHGLCLAPLILGANAIIMIIPPLSFGMAYWLSRKFNWFTWKISEAIAGFSIACSLILMSLWR